MPIPIAPIPQFNPTSLSFPNTNPWFPTFDAQSRYPVANSYAHSTTFGPPLSVHGGTFITAAHVNFYGPKRRREHTDDESLLPQRKNKRRRQKKDGIEVFMAHSAEAMVLICQQIIQSEDIKPINEIGNGPGYFLYIGRNEGRDIIFRVFNKSPNVRQQLESTVAFSRGLMHPNVLRIRGTSPPQSPIQFIAYENIHWKDAEESLASALKHDLEHSIVLGFKMVCNILHYHACSSGLFRLLGLLQG
ncbi:hypothetical protein B0H19DRAFT_1146417 [Mycena capillaripes]|nr:hypothetical protein B0H19DRAFT_1146417 [Mycena capillaripes]